ncbi:MAG: DNA repair protein RadA [Clostridia bacterium]|nr:DNA repair protein RadA [Clostridia bacterium]
MAKKKTTYVCTECGVTHSAWSGRCFSCGAWDTIQEEVVDVSSSPNLPQGQSVATPLSEVSTESESRILSGMAELDRVLGGGIVKGGVMLIGGSPGIGKSTLLLQICKTIGQGRKILYVSGEESARQIKLRADRLQVISDSLLLLCETNVESILENIRSEKPDVVIIDSIQTMSLTDITSSPGSVTQVRECTSVFTRMAKLADIPLFIVGHVNKDGAIAGPKVIEHIVDCVLYFEGERHSSYRLLRCAKNRYGATDEIGMFEMTDQGLLEVENPSLLLLSGRPTNVSGICVACTIEGSRPVLAEVQGLVSPSTFGNPRRMSTGFDNYRLALLLAVLEKRAGYYFSNLDAYVNVIGGLTLTEPAADLPIALALITGLKDVPVSDGIAAFGEVGLTGEIRSVSNANARIAEAARLGFTKVIIPHHNLQGLASHDDIEVVGVKTIQEAFEAIS